MTDAQQMMLDGAEEHRRSLMGAAFRMLGTVADAEDAVQEAYLRWVRLDPAARGAVRSPGAWLMTATARVCLDMLGSARARREQYVGEWLPEPVPLDSPAAGAVDPLERTVVRESVSTALLLVLETLTPAERVAFVLHEVFAVPFGEIAEILGRSDAACRQLATSARRRIAGRAGGDVPRERHDALMAAFAAATASGRLDELVRVLDPDVVLRADGGGRISAARRPVRGADDVARFLLGIARREPAGRYEVVETGDGIGLLLRVDDAVVGLVTLATDADRVTDVWIMRNPDKLGAWR